MSSALGGGRLAELTIALSLASDLGTGQPLEHGLRTCWSAIGAAEALGLDVEQRSCVYHVTLLRFLGCTSDASESAVLVGGDDLSFNGTMAPIVMAEPGPGMLFVLRHIAEDLPLGRRLQAVGRLLSDPGASGRSLAQHCEAASLLAGKLGLPESICEGLAHGYERWDGKGEPDGLAGEDVPIAVRVAVVARDVELFAAAGGWPAVEVALVARRDRAYDPAVVDVFLEGGREWLAQPGGDLCAAVLDAEPNPTLRISDDELDGSLAAVAHFADLKSPWFRRHSTGVAALAADAALSAGRSADDVTLARRAGLLHDVGKVGVPNGVWDRAGPLSAEQWERVRMHSYLTERVLSHCDLLAPYAAVAGAIHERVDGSGYHRGRAGDEVAVAARLVAAADAYHAMCEDRPHRPALTADEAAQSLRAEVGAGRLTLGEVDAVLGAAGHAERPVHVPRPAGLTEREVDVLRLIARGLSNKEAARELGISPKTVGNHIEHIYAKAGVRTRAGVTLFAMEHDLLST